MSNERKRRVMAMRRDGLTYREIGRRLGISGQAVMNMIQPPRSLALQVKIRARHRCEGCRKKLTGGHVHHVREDVEIRNHPNNLLYLCASCHCRVHKTGVLYEG